MTIYNKSARDAALMLVISACLVCPAHAQTLANPTTEELVEQLKAPKTRSIGQKRNLIISKEPDSKEPSASDASASTATGAEPRASVSLSIQFDFNSSALLPDGASTLNRLAAAMKSDALSADRFLIEGHTDAKGSKEFNVRLSKSRAEAVRQHLMGQGIASSRLLAEGKGFSDPANKSDPLSAENRRVKIVNLE